MKKGNFFSLIFGSYEIQIVAAQIVDHLRLTDSRHLSEVAGTDSCLAAPAHEQWLGGDETGRGIHLSSRQPPSLLHPRVSQDILGLLSLTSVQSFPVWTSLRGQVRKLSSGKEKGGWGGVVIRATDEQAHLAHPLERGLELRIKFAIRRHRTGHVQGNGDGIMMFWMLWKGTGMLGFLQLIMERALIKWTSRPDNTHCSSFVRAVTHYAPSVTDVMNHPRNKDESGM